MIHLLLRATWCLLISEDCLYQRYPNSVPHSSSRFYSAFDQFSINHMCPVPFRKMTSVIEAFPIRTKGIHFVNPSTGFDTLFKMFHGFLSKKIQERIAVHDTFEALHKVIPKSFLPEEYGGSGGKLATIIADCRDNLLNNRQIFLEDVKYRNDERKRPGKPKTASTLFGVEGSFRSLEFDWWYFGCDWQKLLKYMFWLCFAL